MTAKNSIEMDFWLIFITHDVLILIEYACARKANTLHCITVTEYGMCFNSHIRINVYFTVCCPYNLDYSRYTKLT